MGKKEERELRKALKQAKFEECKGAYIARSTVELVPKALAATVQDSNPTVAPHLARAITQASKEPKAILDGSRFNSQVTWCTTKSDHDGFWSWNDPRKWTAIEWDSEIHPPFKEFEKLTWREINNFSSESGHKMHHGHEVSDLIQEAQLRWKHLQLEQFDSVFRFRIGARKRVWGYVVQAHFYLVWWDRSHMLYPTSPN